MAEVDPPEPPPLLRQPESRQRSIAERIEKHERDLQYAQDEITRLKKKRNTLRV